MKNKTIWAIIPARSGSKGLKHKNITLFLGKPLLTHSINFAKKLKFIDKIILSTDSIKYKNIIPGYSSHDLTRTAAAMSVALGAKIIEKHIKVSENKWTHFDETALDVNYEFPSWVQYVRSSENILGENIKKIQKSEHHKYSFRKNS